MAKAEDGDWLTPREYVKRKAGDPAAETEVEYSVEEQFRRGKIPYCYRGADGKLHYNDLSDDFLREAVIDLFVTATAPRPERTISKANPGDGVSRWVTAMALSDPNFKLYLPAETITELKFWVPRARAKYRGGRPPEYLWPEWGEALDASLEIEGRPKEKERLVEWSRAWFKKYDAAVPSDREIRRHLKPYYD